MVQLWAMTIAESLVGEFEQTFHARKRPFHNMHIFNCSCTNAKFSKWSFFTIQWNILRKKKTNKKKTN